MNARSLLALLLLMAGGWAPRTGGAEPAAKPEPRIYDEIVAALPHTDASGVVLDKNGAPVDGADVVLYYERHDEGMRNRVAGRVKTDAEGRFRFVKAVVWENIIENRTPRYRMKYDVIASHPGHGIGFAVFTKLDPAENLKISLAPVKPRSITVQDEKGKPVEGALVRLGYLSQPVRPAEPAGQPYAYERFNCRFRYDDLGLASGKTDRNGKVTLRAPGSASFVAEKDGFVPSTGTTITLFRSAQVSGRVLAPDGKPVPGAVIWYMYEGNRLSDRHVTVADREGRYIFKNVSAKGFRYSGMSAKEEEGAPGQSTLVAEDLSRGSRIIGESVKLQLNPGDKKTCDIKMVRAVVLAGQVVNAKTGKPAPNIAMLRSELDRSNYLKNFTTNDQGRFRFLYPAGMDVSLFFDSPRDGSYILDEEQSGRQVWGQTLTADKTDLLLKARLWDVGPLEGVVIDFDGVPSKYPHSIYLHSDIPAVKNGADGHFKLKIAPRDRDFDLFVVGPRKLGGALVHCKAGTTSVTMRTQRFRDYTGVVTTPDGNPANNLKFYLDLKLNGTTIYNVRQEPETNAKGIFVAKGLLPDATYYAWWSADNDRNRDYDYGNATIELAKLQSDQPITFEAKQFINALMGKVVDPEGKPVANAQISIESSEMQPQDARFNKRYASNEKGSFTIDRLASGKVQLRVNHPDYKGRMVETDSDAIDCVIKLNPRGDELAAKVQVLDEQKRPVPSAPVTVSTFRFDSAADKMTSQTQSLSIDAQGRGEFKMNVDRKDPLRSVNGALFVCDKPGYDLAFGSLRPDEDADITLRLRPSKDHWSGQVVDADGKPIAGARVAVAGLRTEKNGPFISLYAEAFSLCSSVTGKDGRFELPRIGRECGLSLTVSAPGYSRLNEWADMESKPQALFTLARGGSIAGKVIVKETGKPFGQGRIIAQSQGSGGGGAMVGPDGSFTIEGLQAGEYRVIFTQQGVEPLKYVPCDTPAVVIEVGKKAAVTLEVQQGVPVSGKVMDPKTGKTPAGQVFVSARSKPNQYLGSGAEMKPDGSFQFYLAPGTYQLTYFVVGQNRPNEAAKPITIEKGKAYDNLIIEAK